MDFSNSWKKHIRKIIWPTLFLLLLLTFAVVRFSHLVEKTREGTTVGRLNDLRQAILLYYQDHNGQFPRELAVSGQFGRYLPRIPAVEPLHPRNSPVSPGGNQISYGTSAPEGFSQGWYYNYENGMIFVNSIGRDTRGISYTAY
ncbi:MAG: hypothetical protein HGA76_02275 [Candidatus Firestonebacteria bacterium]|nr:hypothetical protein [Candidatus Firestonebacteria bacterium]